MSPFEMSEVVIHIKLPLFVLAHFVRHRTASMNSLSARYSVMQDEFYIPDEMRGQSSTNKQGSSGVIDEEKGRFLKNMAKRIPETAYEDYEIMLKFGLSRELSRIFLPQNLYTEIYWKQDLRNVLHLLKLRMDEHAQWETRQYASAVYEIVRVLFPIVVRSWENHTLNSIKISGDEKEILKAVVTNGHDINHLLDGFSAGRAREIVNKINNILDRE
jgi:thymidylate synthase (FAD)